MKKKVLALATSLMIFSGVVSASSINGDYKGNPIVKVTSSGKQLESGEVPAMIYEGNTVVPISLLKQLGASVTWDGDNYTVDVKLPGQSDKLFNNETKLLKSYSKAADHYRKLQVVGESISSAGTYITSAVDIISSNGNNTYASSYIELSEKAINHANNTITVVMNDSNKIYDELVNAGVDISDVKTIITDYTLALKKYSDALDGVRAFYLTKNKNDYNKYYENAEQALNSLEKPRTDSMKKYFEWYNKTQQ